MDENIFSSQDSEQSSEQEEKQESVKISTEQEIINFTKTVLSEHPEVKTASIIKNCFENGVLLEKRRKDKIASILKTAGVKQSKRGEHAIDFDWENKFPQAQWERVFEK